MSVFTYFSPLNHKLNKKKRKIIVFPFFPQVPNRAFCYRGHDHMGTKQMKRKIIIFPSFPKFQPGPNAVEALAICLATTWPV